MRALTPSRVAAVATLVLLGVMSVRPPSALPAAEPLQIAWAGPLTGDVAQLGQGWLNGVKLAVDEWNAKGGVLGRQIVIAPEDDQCDPK
jgi:branched-chain amino acid transport system substrate-binding protein